MPKYRAGVDALVAELASGGVGRMVALPCVHMAGIAVALNDFTREVARSHPEVVPCCTVLPGEDGAERLLEEAFCEQGFAGVKIHCHVMKLLPDDERLDPVWRASAKQRKPVVIHAGREPAIAAYGLRGAGATRAAEVPRGGGGGAVPGADEFAEFEGCSASSRTSTSTPR